MNKKSAKKLKTPLEIKEAYHKEIIIKPAERLLQTLLKAEEKELFTITKACKTSTSSR